MRARWNALAERERRMLVAGSAILVLLLGWALIWHPLALARERLAADVASDRDALAWMRAAQQQASAPGADADHASADRQGKSLLALTDASARSAGLASALKRVEPVGTHSVRVNFEAANFDALIGWIESLSRDYGVQATDFSADRAEGNGMVNARVTLEDG